jgi:hypothetical protein
MKYSELVDSGATSTQVMDYLSEGEPTPITLRVPRNLKDAAAETLASGASASRHSSARASSTNSPRGTRGWQDRSSQGSASRSTAEVFTNEREVNAMLDMVKQETERIDSRFLEPACGDGNFLSEVLRRKLDVVDSRYRRSLPEWERYAFIAVGRIYGVELLRDNTITCRKRLYGIVGSRYARVSKGSQKPGLP